MCFPLQHKKRERPAAVVRDTGKAAAAADKLVEQEVDPLPEPVRIRLLAKKPEKEPVRNETEGEPENVEEEIADDLAWATDDIVEKLDTRYVCTYVELLN